METRYDNILESPAARVAMNVVGFAIWFGLLFGIMSAAVAL